MLFDPHGRPRVGHLRTGRPCADGRDKPGHDGEDSIGPPDFSPAKPYPDAFGDRPGHRVESMILVQTLVATGIAQ